MHPPISRLCNGRLDAKSWVNSGVSQRTIAALKFVYNWAQGPDGLPLSIQERACARFKTINTYFETGS